ncbi:MAG: hypothetical protein AAFW46_05205 [Pseudomonadota bacterium]
MTDSASATSGRPAGLFLSFEREAFFDAPLHAALSAVCAPPLIGLTRRALADPEALDRALDRVRRALAEGGGPLILAVEGTALVSKDGLAFRLPQGRLFTGRRLRALLDDVGASQSLLLIDAALIRNPAPSDLATAYRAALAADLASAATLCLARAPEDARPLAPRFAAAIAGTAGETTLSDLIQRLPAPGSPPLIAPSAEAAAAFALRLVAETPEARAGARPEMAPREMAPLEMAPREIAEDLLIAGDAPDAFAHAAPSSPSARAAPTPAHAAPGGPSTSPSAPATDAAPSAPATSAGATAAGRAVAALLHHTAPGLMRAHRRHPVEVAISKDLSGAAAEGLRGAVRTEALKATGLMAVRLVDDGDAFEIRGRSVQIQDIDFAAGREAGLAQEGPARGLWRFDVTPRRVGTHHLSIEASAYLRGADGAPVLVPSATRRIPVRVTVNFGLGLRRVASWLLLGVLGVLVFKFGVEVPLETALAEHGGWRGLIERIETGG